MVSDHGYLMEPKCDGKSARQGKTSSEENDMFLFLKLKCFIILCHTVHPI